MNASSFPPAHLHRDLHERVIRSKDAPKGATAQLKVVSIGVLFKAQLAPRDRRKQGLRRGGRPLPRSDRVAKGDVDTKPRRVHLDRLTTRRAGWTRVIPHDPVAKVGKAEIVCATACMKQLESRDDSPTSGLSKPPHHMAVTGSLQTARQMAHSKGSRPASSASAISQSQETEERVLKYLHQVACRLALILVATKPLPHTYSGSTRDNQG